MNSPKLGDRCPYCGKGEVILPSQLGKPGRDHIYLLCDNRDCQWGYSLNGQCKIVVEWVGPPGQNRKPARLK